MPVEVMLLPSPFLGPAAWRATAQALRRAGWAATVCDTPTTASSADEVLESFLGSIPRSGSLALVPHSNAGLFVPEIYGRRDVEATVFVDAALPPDAGSFPLGPESLFTQVADKVDDDGWLPPWTEWWADSDVRALVPDPAARSEVEHQQPRVALSYLRSRLDAPAGWDQRPTAYLAFGDTYADETRRAEQRGWPVERLPGRHLHMLVAPVTVANRIVGLLSTLGVKPIRELSADSTGTERRLDGN